MIVYNITIKVDWSIHQEWLAFMREKHIPDVLNTGLFHGHKMYRIMEEDEQDGVTYSVQYHLHNITDYFTYQNDHASKLQEEHTNLFKDKFVAFRTLLREV